MAEQQSAAAASAPLLGSARNHPTADAGTYHDSRDGGHTHENYYDNDDGYNMEDEGVSTWRRACARALASRRKHFLVMGVVALDVATLLANIFIQLIACETHQADEPWVVTVTTTLEVVGLVFSTAFMLELLACIYAFGWRYLSSKFHLFDSAIIVLSFLVDVSLRGPAESIGSLLVVLRLWRLAKISEEVVLGATERMEMLEHHIDDIEAENKHLRAAVAKAQDQSRETRARHSSVN
ncbi:Ion transport [Akanthomyces lecanii RCEF 1005]|uniref:Voltage-gated hydrogen channel 1 n=1 Tax=Akanthomyces lecanii RCEF 1005 TaxID=1081108 RepID=A0A162KTP7_CORDF|nr:Ion transport [Akanthomyces lecanii RCEF 1005]